jgi:hypothetical protein
LNYLIRPFLLIVVLTILPPLCHSQESKTLPYGMPSDSPSLIENNLDAWKEYYSPQGKFKVMLPGTPKDWGKSYNTLFGQLYSHLYMLRTSAKYLIIYTDFPLNLERAPKLNKILDEIRDAAVSKGTVLNETEISLEGHPGRMLKGIDSDARFIQMKTYAVGNRLYQIIITTPKETMVADEGRFKVSRATKFLDSFRLAKPEDSGREAVAFINVRCLTAYSTL